MSGNYKKQQEDISNVYVTNENIGSYVLTPRQLAIYSIPGTFSVPSKFAGYRSAYQVKLSTSFGLFCSYWQPTQSFSCRTLSLRSRRTKRKSGLPLATISLVLHPAALFPQVTDRRQELLPWQAVSCGTQHTKRHVLLPNCDGGQAAAVHFLIALMLAVLPGNWLGHSHPGNLHSRLDVQICMRLARFVGRRLCHIVLLLTICTVSYIKSSSPPQCANHG